MHFEMKIFIPFHLVDAAGVVFFGQPFTLAHQIFEQFVIAKLDIPWNQWFHNKQWIIPIRHSEADFVNPLYAGQECLIKLRIDNVSASSFTLRYDFYQQELRCCSLTTVHVFCDKATGAKIDIPDNIRTKLLEPHKKSEIPCI